jgi:hypothetical protein
MELPHYTQGRAVDEGALSARIRRYQGARLEGAVAPAQDLPSAHCEGKTLSCRHGRGCSRIARVHLVDRTTRATRRLNETRLALRSSEDAGRGRGNPRFCFGQATTPTSVARARQPSDAPSSWGTQPPHRSLSDRREISASSPLRIATIRLVNARKGGWQRAPKSR